MYIIIDVLLILILFLFLYSGYKQGFIKAGIGFICFAVSFVLASILSPIISTYVYDSFISQRLISSINNALNASQYGLAKKTIAVMESLPKFLTNSFESCKISASNISAILIKEKDPAKEISNLVRPMINSILNPIILILITSVLTLFSNLLLKSLRKVTKPLFVGKVDSVLGLAFGGLKYAILIFIVTLSLKSIMPLCSANVSGKVNDIIDNTLIAKYIVNLDFSTEVIC